MIRSVSFFLNDLMEKREKATDCNFLPEKLRRTGISFLYTIATLRLPYINGKFKYSGGLVYCSRFHTISKKVKKKLE